MKNPSPKLRSVITQFLAQLSKKDLEKEIRKNLDLIAFIDDQPANLQIIVYQNSHDTSNLKDLKPEFVKWFINQKNRSIVSLNKEIAKAFLEIATKEEKIEEFKIDYVLCQDHLSAQDEEIQAALIKHDIGRYNDSSKTPYLNSVVLQTAGSFKIAIFHIDKNDDESTIYDPSLELINAVLMQNIIEK